MAALKKRTFLMMESPTIIVVGGKSGCGRGSELECATSPWEEEGWREETGAPGWRAAQSGSPSAMGHGCRGAFTAESPDAVAVSKSTESFTPFGRRGFPERRRTASFRNRRRDVDVRAGSRRSDVAAEHWPTPPGAIEEDVGIIEWGATEAPPDAGGEDGGSGAPEDLPVAASPGVRPAVEGGGSAPGSEPIPGPATRAEPASDSGPKRFGRQSCGGETERLAVFFPPRITTSVQGRWWLGVEQEDGRGLMEPSQCTVSWRAVVSEWIRRDCS